MLCWNYLCGTTDYFLEVCELERTGSLRLLLGKIKLPLSWFNPLLNLTLGVLDVWTVAVMGVLEKVMLTWRRTCTFYSSGHDPANKSDHSANLRFHSGKSEFLLRIMLNFVTRFMQKHLLHRNSKSAWKRKSRTAKNRCLLSIHSMHMMSRRWCGNSVALSPLCWRTYAGTYLTHEAKGAEDAPDADTAIINAEGNQAHAAEKKEYFI